MISVLFVDDEPALLEITRLYLEKNGSMTVETCRSALEALGILKNRKFDVIVSDYEMPLMDGIMFLKILRAEKNDTPFLIFTGKGREHVVIEALNNGADFYLQKGGDPKDTVHRTDPHDRTGGAETGCRGEPQSLGETTRRDHQFPPRRHICNRQRRACNIMEQGDGGIIRNKIGNNDG